MVQHRKREEVINTCLAELISGLGTLAEPETIHVHGKHRPDVYLELSGLRINIESKFGGVPNSKKIVLEDAHKRVESGFAQLAVAVIYPDKLRTMQQGRISSALKNSILKYQIVAETFQEEVWYEGTATEILESLRRVQGSLAESNVVEKTARQLNDSLIEIAALWATQEGVCDRLSNCLGIGIPENEKDSDSVDRRETVAKVSALVLASAFIFQEQLSRSNKNVNTLNSQEKEEDLITATLEHWKWIWENINYVSVFRLGEKILKAVTMNNAESVSLLLREAKNICLNQAALRHDLMGRIYHWLLHDKKYLGTFYTSVSAATLLLKLAFSVDWKQDFGDPDQLADFKAADFSCGTGTLLMATTQAISDEYIRARADSDRSLEPQDLSILHRALMEHVLHGYDILPTAVHLTASTLALLAPNITFKNMHLYALPQGIDHDKKRLGSLDFLEGATETQLSLGGDQKDIYRISADQSYATVTSAPKLNLCVMNPPFVRSVASNLLFGSLPDEERKILQKELKKRVKNLNANSVAGLGSVFIALGDKYLKEDGRLAIVLPIALATGEAWGSTRQLIADKYHLEMVITSYDAERMNFSENTNLSEILFIARKLRKEEKKSEKSRTTYINLWHNPTSIHEAMYLASKIKHVDNNIAQVEKKGITEVRFSNKKMAEMISAPTPANREIWQGAIISQSELFRVCQNLQRGNLRLPNNKKNFTVPMTSIFQLGSLGYDVRDVTDAFELGGDMSRDGWSQYSAFWSHDHKTVRTIAQTANTRLIARTTPLKGRPFRDPAQVWSKAGKVLLSAKLRLNTQRLIAIGLSEPVLGNTWWEMDTSKLTEEQIKSLLLFLNSTFGIALYFARRVVTKGALTSQKKPAWESMPVLNVRKLSGKQLKDLASVYAKLAQQPLKPIFQLAADKTRIAIDNALCDVIGLPDIKPLRELLSHETGMREEKTVTRSDNTT